MKARFWVYANGGWVKLTLGTGQSLEHVSGGRTEEGYSWTATTWRFDGQMVIRESATQASDCDGRFDSAEDAYCHVHALRRVSAWERYECDKNVGIMVPEWTDAGCSQRDYAAEAMGY